MKDFGGIWIMIGWQDFWKAVLGLITLKSFCRRLKTKRKEKGGDEFQSLYGKEEKLIKFLLSY